MPEDNKGTPILILGAGTFGLSTAYHLARSGYKNITVLEKGSSVPSDISAGNDLNKIVRAEYEDPFYTELALEAIREWKRPLLSPYYHENGYLLATSPTAPEKSKATLQRALKSISSHPTFADSITPLRTRGDIRKVAPVFTGPMQWTGYFNRYAGYVHAADAMRAMYSACIALGVNFKLGDGVTGLLKQATGEKEIVCGATTASGKKYEAPVTVVALGACVSSIIPALSQQICGRGFPLAHIQLTPEEAERLRGLPVTYARDLGFFFEPDRRTNLLKICPSGGGYTNYGEVAGARASIPPIDLQDSAFITAEDEQKIRKLLGQSLPELADRPLVQKRICWCADSGDTDFVIDYVPGTEGLIVATGDSGQAFKMLPTAGRWVKDVIENRDQKIDRWRWKNISQGDVGSADYTWRVGVSKDLKDITPTRSKL